jgi:hypothetical protein
MRYEPPAINFHLGERRARERKGRGQKLRALVCGTPMSLPTNSLSYEQYAYRCPAWLLSAASSASLRKVMTATFLARKYGSTTCVGPPSG